MLVVKLELNIERLWTFNMTKTITVAFFAVNNLNWQFCLPNVSLNSNSSYSKQNSLVASFSAIRLKSAIQETTVDDRVKMKVKRNWWKKITLKWTYTLTNVTAFNINRNSVELKEKKTENKIWNCRNSIN